MEKYKLDSPWWQRNLKKYGSVSAVLEEQKRRASAGGKKNKGTATGFAIMSKQDPERHRRLSRKGMASRYGKVYNEEES